MTLIGNSTKGSTNNKGYEDHPTHEHQSWTTTNNFRFCFVQSENSTSTTKIFRQFVTITQRAKMVFISSTTSTFDVKTASPY